MDINNNNKNQITMRNLIYLLAFLIIGCSNEIKEAPVEGVDLTTQGKRGNNKVAKRTINLEPATPLARLVNDKAIGNIMLEPVDYTGELPLNDNGGFVDWDGDGLDDDQIIIENRCYWPRTFVEVSVLLDGVDKHVINYSTAYGAKLLGFKDVDGNGTQDVIFEGGNHYFYNGSTYGGTFTPIDSYSQFNVGYNVEGQYPISLKEIIQSLVITSADPNPEAITWDLSDYGIEAYPFHVFLIDVNAGFYSQTVTYGEWGYYNFSPTGNRVTPGEPYILRFTNLGDGCTDVDVNFSI